MYFDKRNTILQLQKEILPLQGFKFSACKDDLNIDLGPINSAFPGKCFPFGAVHEFLSFEAAHFAPTSGFIAALLAALMRKGGVAIWISSSGTIFPAALKTFHIDPDSIIFVDLQKQKDILWATEETLKCSGFAAVIAELQDLSFTASRRLQLAVEQSGVTGFIIRQYSRNLNNTACVSRWKITSLPSAFDDEMPGVGFPRWNVELLKMRNGKPGVWQMEWSAGKFHHISPLIVSIPEVRKTKTG